MRLATLFEDWAHVLPATADALEVVGITHELRRVAPGHVFALLDGAGDRGPELAKEAATAGAIAVLTDETSTVGEALPRVIASAVRPAFAAAAARLSGHPDRDLRVIAVTGTNGKSTTVHVLGQVLAGRGGCGRIGTLYIDDGAVSEVATKTTPEAGVVYPALRRMLANGCRYAAMEASSHGLTQQRLHGMHLRYGIFTNLTQDHLDYHGDMASYLAAKQRLFALLPAEGWAILNQDDPAGRSMPVPRARRLTYGQGEAADLRLEPRSLDRSGAELRFHWRAGDQVIDAHVPLLGVHNAYNLAAVLAVLLLEGVPLAEAAASLADVDAPAGRMQRIAGPGFEVMVDYAHTPDALEKVLGACRALRPGRLLLVFGAAGNKDRGKRAQMGAIAGRLADRIYLTSDNPRREDPEAILDMIAAGVEGVAGEHRRIVDRREAIAAALDDARPGDLVLVAGKGHETTQEIGDRTLPFDDRAVVRELLGARGGAEEAAR